MEQNVMLAFALTTLAGLSTGVGSALAFFTRRTNRRFLAASLGLSAGVMIYVSFVELFTLAREYFSRSSSKVQAEWFTAVSFFVGMMFMAVIDRLVPAWENPHEPRTVESMDAPAGDRRDLHRVGLFAALAIAIHNFPEGLATFASTLSDARVGVSVAVAVAIHNIPEGIAVSVPLYFATGQRSRAFWLSFASGLSEPLGAVAGYLVLRPFLDDSVLGALFAGISGIMVFISLDELLPAAREYGEGHVAIYGVIAGMAVMALSLLLGR
ncbi:MAG: zinc transporter ZupT [Candidatus Riflebacteria bacterium]|nr:zinc transporter ZupT [Candidatus Riflebacteria bacterium]